MIKGLVTPNEAVKIDVQLWDPWENYERVYFAWEAKLIVEQKLDKKRKYLISKYIMEGMLRFLDEEYSKDVDDAGMLGYILIGEADNIVKSLNRSLVNSRRNGRFSRRDHLKLDTAVGAFKDVYVSSHNRVACGRPIKLHHLFLAFDFNRQTYYQTELQLS